MISARCLAVRLGIAASLIAGASAFLFLPISHAQVMGEYGAATANSAGAATAAPHADLPSIPGPSADAGSGGSATSEVREDDSSPQDEQAADSGANQSRDDWNEVKGSDDGN
jgi:hypothetical protein